MMQGNKLGLTEHNSYSLSDSRLHFVHILLDSAYIQIPALTGLKAGRFGCESI